MTISHGMLVVVIHANQSEFKTKFKDTSCIKLSLMQSVLPCALPTPECGISLWNSQCHSDGNCLILPYIPVSCLSPLRKLDFLKVQTMPLNERECPGMKKKASAWFTHPLKAFSFFNRPTEILWGFMALLSSIPATSNVVVQKLLQLSHFCHWLLWGKHCQPPPLKATSFQAFSVG